MSKKESKEKQMIYEYVDDISRRTKKTWKNSGCNWLTFHVGIEFID
jgi:hypothetical protein